VLLARRFEARHVTSAEFRDAVELFADVAVEWQERLDPQAGAAGPVEVPVALSGGVPSFA
jgi:hypothetical protein